MKPYFFSFFFILLLTLVSKVYTQQKPNVISSKEGESVGAIDVMPQIVWTDCFVETLGCRNVDTIARQDNKSAILIEQNGLTMLLH